MMSTPAAGRTADSKQIPMNLSRITTSIAVALLASFTSFSQTYRLPGQHTNQAQELLADQAKINHSISVKPTIDYLNYSEEEEPESDIYSIGWNSNMVNCYANVTVPQTKVIRGLDKFHMPCRGYVTSPYGFRPRFGRMHRGVDLKASIGDTIYSTFDGRVRLTKYEAKGYGYYVVVRHTNDLETVYGHLTRFLVKPGEYVKAGTPIGLAGSTGRSTGPHLHFETRFMGYAINPAAIFDFANQTTHTDTYTFDKRTYQQPRNYSPEANASYAQSYNSSRAKAAYSNKRSSSKASAKKSYESKKSAKASKKEAKSKNTTIRKGDSLSKIAARNGMSVKKLCQINGIKASHKLQPGQSLRVK